jgi:hypothetical protein
MKILQTGILCLIAILCSLSALLLLIQEDPWLKHKVQESITVACSANFACTFQAEVVSINLLTGTITLKQISVCDPDNHQTWYWKADTLCATISYLRSYRQKKLSMNLLLHKLTVYSQMTPDNLAILPHFLKLITPMNNALPVEIPQIVCNNARGMITQKNLSCSFTAHAKAELFTNAQETAYRLHVMLTGGSLSHANHLLADSFAGKVEGKIPLRSATPNAQSSVSYNCSCTLAHQPTVDATCQLSGTCSPEKTTLHAQNTTNTIAADLFLGKKENKCHANITAPLAYLGRLCSLPTTELAGICKLTAQTTWNNLLENSQCKIDIENPFYQQTQLPELHIALAYDTQQLRGPVQCSYNNTPWADGSVTYDLATGTLTAKLVQVTPQVENPLRGTVYLTKDELTLHGAAGSYSADIAFSRKPTFHIAKGIVYRDNEPLIRIKAESPNQFLGTISCTSIGLLANRYGLRVSGQGDIVLRGDIQRKTTKLDFLLDDGNIRLPHTYNLLRRMHGTLTFHPANKLLTLDDFSLQFHKGSMNISHAQALFEESYKPIYAHIPLLLHNCFLGIKKDLFALFSGAFAVIYNNKLAQITGNLLLDKPHIRNNILSEEFIKNIVGTKVATPTSEAPRIQLNIQVSTVTPLRVKTPFLDAAAHANIHIKDSLTYPSITGDIDILQGSFLFPYKPLFIKRGKIYFLPTQFDDPVIDIVAENNIRKYAVRMTVDGTAKNSRITFDATPHLQEEQIIALLLGGSEDGSLFLAMPTSVMNSVERLIFGPAESASQFQRGLKSLFAPLKNLKITPSFSDQSARGGLRGSLVIDVNDRLRGIIEQNFSLSEDVVVQVEYDLSDDARIRAIRDERGDLGGEVEARWKF